MEGLRQQPMYSGDIHLNNNLGVIYKRCGNYEKSKECYDYALGKERSPLAVGLNEFGEPIDDVSDLTVRV